jgi:hypothetical protein
MEATLSEFEIMRFKGSGEKNTINFLQQKEIFQIRMHAMYRTGLEYYYKGPP